MHCILDEQLNNMNNKNPSINHQQEKVHNFCSSPSQYNPLRISNQSQWKKSHNFKDSQSEQKQNVSVNKEFTEQIEQSKYEGNYRSKVNDTPESLNYGTSSYGLKQSTLSKNEQENQNLMQSSLRGIIFSSNNQQKESINLRNSENSMFKSYNSHKDQSYNQMQSNLKSLQDKIKDLETKLTGGNDDTVIIHDKDRSSIMKHSKKQRDLNENKATISNLRLRSHSKSVTRLQNLQEESIKKRNDRNKNNSIIGNRKNKDRESSKNSKASSNIRSSSVTSLRHRPQSSLKSQRNKPTNINNRSSQSLLRSSSAKRNLNLRTDTDDVKKLKEELYKERKRNLDIQRQLEAFKRTNNSKERNDKKVKQLKKDYKDLLEAFEKSEKIRKEQKELIHNMKKELNKLRKESQENSNNLKCDDIENCKQQEIDSKQVKDKKKSSKINGGKSLKKSIR